MKHGKKPTLKQKEFIASKKLLPQNWLVERDTPDEIVIVSRKGYTRTYQKRVEGESNV